MNNRVRFIAGCAGFALVLSAVTGLFAGIPAGRVLLRAGISGLLFGLFAVGAQAVVARYLPELNALLEGSTRSSGGERQTPGVDIVVDDEEPLGDAGVALETEQDNFERAGPEEAANAETGESAGAVAGSAPDDGDDLVEVVPTPDELAAEAEEIGTDERRPAAKPEYDPADAVDPGSVDQLPDVGSFSDGFADAGDANDDSGGSSQSDDQDPAMMARALQTMLKRDT